MTAPVMRQCRAPGCRAWYSVDLDVCPFCDARASSVRFWIWVDRIVVVSCLAALAGLVYRYWP